MVRNLNQANPIPNSNPKPFRSNLFEPFSSFSCFEDLFKESNSILNSIQIRIESTTNPNRALILKIILIRT